MLSSKRRILAIGICAVCFGAGSFALGTEPTTVALTMTRPADAKEAQQLAENLLTLVELALQADKSLAIVERRQIELMIQELLLNQSRSADAQLQLGKLLTADFLVMLEILKSDKDSQKPWGRLRVVDPKTGAIRGVSVAGVDEATLEETAEQFASYASAVLRSPDKPTVTVAVAPFESKGRFDRLRPLELGIRDLVTARLLELSGALPVGPTDTRDKTAAAQPLRFQVVQRSNMEQLLRELDLIQSGLSDKSRLPEILPERAAAYLVRGDIDERQVNDQFTIVVRGEMIQAVTQRVVETFEVECAPPDLETQLATQVDRIGNRLLEDEKIAQPAHLEGTFEIQGLKQLALDDVRRFVRLLATTHEVQRFGVTGQRSMVAPQRKVHVDTPLGHHLLRKSIDRLESILFITPDDAGAAYALGFCYSIHEKDIYQPTRADELLRKAYALDPEARLAAAALELRAEIPFDDRTGELTGGNDAVTIERVWFAFEQMPPKCRDSHWVELLKILGRLHDRPDQTAALADLLAKAAPFVEEMDPAVRFRPRLANRVQGLAIQLIRQAHDQPALKAKGMELLHRWADGPDELLADFGSQGLATVLLQQGDFLGAAAAYEASAAKIVDPRTRRERETRDRRLVDAAKTYRIAKQPQRALELLLSFEERLAADEVGAAFETPPQSATELLGRHGFEVGACYEALGEREKAHAAYLRAVTRCPAIIGYDNSLQRLNALGGIPLRQDRDVDVRYFSRAGEPAVIDIADHGMRLACNGHKIYHGGKDGLYAFDLAKEDWEPAPLKLGRITCLEISDGRLWVGTDADGLWQYDISSGQWSRPEAASQLPDKHIESLTLAGQDVYLGVGAQGSGGLIQIDRTGELRVFSESGAPPVAPNRIIVDDKRLLAETPGSIYAWSFETKSWSQPLEGSKPWRGVPHLFAGKTAIWASLRTEELTKWEATASENERFRSAWDIPVNNPGIARLTAGGGYLVKFVTEHDDEVWFGGHPWIPFVSAGLYRFNMKTGASSRFGPGEGFKACWFHRVYDGLWLGDRLWLATSEGLCVVTPIRSPSVAEGSQAVDEHPR